MSRQLDLQRELRETKKRDALIRALEFGLAGSLENQGIELLGFTIKYSPFNCLLTLRVDNGGSREVAFVGSDTIINCILKADSEANRVALKFRKDKYQPSDT